MNAQGQLPGYGQQQQPIQQQWIGFNDEPGPQTAAPSHFPQQGQFPAPTAHTAGQISAPAGGGSGGWVDFGSAQVIPTTTFVSARDTVPPGYNVQHTGYVAPGAYNVQHTGYAAPGMYNVQHTGYMAQPAYNVQHTGYAAPPAYNVQQTGYAAPPAYNMQYTGYMAQPQAPAPAYPQQQAVASYAQQQPAPAVSYPQQQHVLPAAPSWGGTQQFSGAPAPHPTPATQAPAYGLQPAGYSQQYGAPATHPTTQVQPTFNHPMPSQPSPYGVQPQPTSYGAPAAGYGAGHTTQMTPQAPAQAWPGQPSGYGAPPALSPSGSVISPEAAQAALAAAGLGNAFSAVGHATQMANPTASTTWAAPAAPAPAANTWMSFEDDAPAPPSAPGFTAAAHQLPTPPAPPPVASAAAPEWAWQPPPAPAALPAAPVAEPPTNELQSRSRPLDSFLFAAPPDVNAPTDPAAFASGPQAPEPGAWNTPPAHKAPAPAAMANPWQPTPAAPAAPAAPFPAPAAPAEHPFTATFPAQPPPVDHNTFAAFPGMLADTYIAPGLCGRFSNPTPPTAIQQHAGEVGYSETPSKGPSPADPPVLAAADTQAAGWMSFEDDAPAAPVPVPLPAFAAAPVAFPVAAQPTPAPGAWDAGHAFQEPQPHMEPPPHTAPQAGLSMGQAPDAPAPPPAAAAPHALAPPPPVQAPPVPSYAVPLPEDMFTASPTAASAASESEQALQQLHMTMLAINTSKTSGLPLQQSLALVTATSGSPRGTYGSSGGGSFGGRAGGLPGSVSSRLMGSGHASPLAMTQGGHASPLTASLGGDAAPLAGTLSGQASNPGVAPVPAPIGGVGAGPLPEGMFGAVSSPVAPQAAAVVPSGWASFGDDDEPSAAFAAPAFPTAFPAPPASVPAPPAAFPAPPSIPAMPALPASAADPQSASLDPAVVPQDVLPTADAYDSDSGESDSERSSMPAPGAAQVFSQIFSPQLAAAVAAAAAAEAKVASVTGPTAGSAAAAAAAGLGAEDSAGEVAAPMVPGGSRDLPAFSPPDSQQLFQETDNQLSAQPQGSLAAAGNLAAASERGPSGGGAGDGLEQAVLSGPEAWAGDFSEPAALPAAAVAEELPPASAATPMAAGAQPELPAPAAPQFESPSSVDDAQPTVAPMATEAPPVGSAGPTVAASGDDMPAAGQAAFPAAAAAAALAATSGWVGGFDEPEVAPATWAGGFDEPAVAMPMPDASPAAAAAPGTRVGGFEEPPVTPATWAGGFDEPAAEAPVPAAFPAAAAAAATAAAAAAPAAWVGGFDDPAALDMQADAPLWFQASPEATPVPSASAPSALPAEPDAATETADADAQPTPFQAPAQEAAAQETSQLTGAGLAALAAAAATAGAVAAVAEAATAEPSASPPPAESVAGPTTTAASSSVSDSFTGSRSQSSTATASFPSANMPSMTGLLAMQPDAIPPVIIPPVLPAGLLRPPSPQPPQAWYSSAAGPPLSPPLRKSPTSRSRQASPCPPTSLRASPTSRATSTSGATGLDVPITRRASWRQQELLASGEPDALELSIAAAEALHLAKQAAASEGILFGAPPGAAGRGPQAPYQGDDEEDEGSPVRRVEHLTHRTSTALANTSSSGSGTSGAGGIQPTGSLRNAFSQGLGPQHHTATAVGAAAGVTTQGSLRSSRGSNSSLSVVRPPSPPLHTWQRDSFSHASKRTSLELGIAAAEAAALAARASSRSSLDLQLSPGAMWGAAASPSAAGFDSLFAGADPGPTPHLMQPQQQHPSLRPSRLSVNGLARVREDSGRLETRDLPAEMGAQLPQAVVLGSSLFGSPAPPAVIVHGFAAPTSPREGADGDQAGADEDEFKRASAADLAHEAGMSGGADGAHTGNVPQAVAPDASWAAAGGVSAGDAQAVGLSRAPSRPPSGGVGFSRSSSEHVFADEGPGFSRVPSQQASGAGLSRASSEQAGVPTRTSTAGLGDAPVAIWPAVLPAFGELPGEAPAVLPAFGELPGEAPAVLPAFGELPGEAPAVPGWAMGMAEAEPEPAPGWVSFNDGLALAQSYESLPAAASLPLAGITPTNSAGYAVAAVGGLATRASFDEPPAFGDQPPAFGEAPTAFPAVVPGVEAGSYPPPAAGAGFDEPAAFSTGFDEPAAFSTGADDTPAYGADGEPAPAVMSDAEPDASWVMVEKEADAAPEQPDGVQDGEQHAASGDAAPDGASPGGFATEAAAWGEETPAWGAAEAMVQPPVVSPTPEVGSFQASTPAGAPAETMQARWQDETPAWGAEPPADWQAPAQPQSRDVGPTPHDPMQPPAAAPTALPAAALAGDGSTTPVGGPAAGWMSFNDDADTEPAWAAPATLATPAMPAAAASPQAWGEAVADAAQALPPSADSRIAPAASATGFEDSAFEHAASFESPGWALRSDDSGGLVVSGSSGEQRSHSGARMAMAAVMGGAAVVAGMAVAGVTTAATGVAGVATTAATGVAGAATTAATGVAGAATSGAKSMASAASAGMHAAAGGVAAGAVALGDAAAKLKPTLRRPPPPIPKRPAPTPGATPEAHSLPSDVSEAAPSIMSIPEVNPSVISLPSTTPSTFAMAGLGPSTAAPPPPPAYEVTATSHGAPAMAAAAATVAAGAVIASLATSAFPVHGTGESAPPPAYDSIAAAYPPTQSLEEPPPPAYEAVVTSANQGPPPPPYESVAGHPPPPPYESVVSQAPPPPYESVAGHSSQGPPPPPYESVMGHGPPPPPYESVVGHAAPPPHLQQPAGPGHASAFGALPVLPPATAPIKATQGKFDSMFGFAMSSEKEQPATPVIQADATHMGSPSQRGIITGPPATRGNMGTATVLPPLAAVQLASIAHVVRDSGCQGAPLFKDPVNSHDEQLCVEVRLPPLQHKKTFLPKRLESGFNSLFAMPGPPGRAMLQWAAADSQLVVPQGLNRATEEDPDCAPCGAVPLPESSQTPISSALMDEVSGNMWAGHVDGRVTRWSVAIGRGARCEQVFKAHTQHKIRCLALTAWGDLWTGSSSGMLRVWSQPGGALGTRSPAQALEVKRPSGYRPHGKVLALAASCSGRTVWSAGTSHILIWDAYSGGCVGCIGEPSNRPADEGMTWIDILKGVDPVSVRSHFKHRPGVPRVLPAGATGTAGSSEDEAEDPQASTLATVAKGMSAMGKFAAKIGKKLNKTAATVSKNIQDLDRKDREAQATDPLDATGQTDQRRGKIKAMLPTLDYAMIVVYKTGHVDRYSEYGRLGWTQEARMPLMCGVLIGRSLWVGGGDGCIRVYDSVSGAPQACWPAHLAPVKSLVAVKGIVYSLGRDGSIKGWPALQPPAPQYLSAWKELSREGLRAHQLQVLAGTWNVNTSKASPQSVYEWLGKRAEKAHIVCVGLQEVEMGTSSVAFDAAMSVLNKGALEKGTGAGQWWADTILHALGGSSVFARVGLRQMAGILIVVYVRRELERFMGEVVTDNVACGLYGVGGNKGATAVSVTLHRRRFVFVSSHFAAHQERVDQRNNDYLKIIRGLRFQDVTGAVRPAPPGTTPTKSGRYATPSHHRGVSSGGTPAAPSTTSPGPSQPLDEEEEEDLPTLASEGSTCPLGLSSRVPSSNSLAVTPASVMAKDIMGMGLLTADVVIWMGDFNYRIHAPYDYVVDKVVAGSLPELVMMDQARQEITKGTIFQGMCEGPLSFPPTYKFDRGTPSGTYADGNPMPRYRGTLMPYDSSEKKRIPAWTDRIFFRGSLLPLGVEVAREEDLQLKLPEGQDAGATYGAVLQVCDSDHKPVFAALDLTLPAFSQEHKRKCSMQVITALLGEIITDAPPALSVELSPQQRANQVQGAVPQLSLKADSMDGILIRNTSPGMVTFTIAGDGNPCWRLPSWLDVLPTSAVMLPGSTIMVKLRGAAAEGAFGTGSATHAKQEAVLRVYVQQIVSGGTGQLNALAPDSQALLVKVLHSPY